MSAVKLYTMCIVQNEKNEILLINRPDKLGFPGYIGPGGKVDFPESLTEGAIREVWEETGLRVGDLEYKGLDENIDPNENERYMVFNYLAKTYEGELLDDAPEGEPRWVSVEQALKLPMQWWFKRRLPLFFEPGTFEIYTLYDNKSEQTLKETIKEL
ncbi:8-oxo-dGTP diphosphatase [Alkalicoccobacillus plakortidis]|uniref:8-oxo-dGTP diphosphatase n=1 Tax=Alkalicoccobacillus plakortidis TaxID=444060 RepID=A0ABT0XE41_9BACI|nr:8-oxo-dGTP diphosphatase [Alkalicoccobacillus plakortidis]MCM2674165.1 8-oxo-dGTP diphosphatase [Alkalicoccobacillus plakortidis]